VRRFTDLLLPMVLTKVNFQDLIAESKKKEQTIVSGLVIFSIQRSLGTSWLQ
jgi:hypothetical protein